MNVGPGSVSKVGGGGGGAGTPQFGGQSTSGSGANGSLIWFEEPVVANPPVVHDNAYYTFNHSPYALVTNTYKRLEHSDNRVVDYYTSVVVGGDTANISFKNTMVGLSAEILLVGGGGGGGGGDDTTRTYSCRWRRRRSSLWLLSCGNNWTTDSPIYYIRYCDW